MNDRQRFHATMHGQPCDRSPICDFGFWDETIEAWHEQGLPRHLPPDNRGDAVSRWLGMDPLPLGTGGEVELCPAFECLVLEDRGDRELVQQADGVRVVRHKRMSSIPMHAGHLLTDRASWERHYKPRLDPDDPNRLPQGEAWEQQVATWCDPQRNHPLALWCGSLFGKIRDWMGLEAISYVPFDDPAWFEEMVHARADVTVAVLEKVLATGGRFEAAAFWEDMCYNAGPLLSPAHFKRYLVPQYKRITDLLHRHGIDIVWVDCDGCIDELIPLWLEAGVNTMFPIEVGTWGADPVAMRRQYGRDLRLMGGFSKRILAQSPAAIEAEVHRLAPLVEEGGYIGFCDHRVPPDVSLANYLHYLHTARRVWGKDLNLKPLGRPQPQPETTSP
ncbi:MAG: uroporphyrinogen decarboxylase family protein [Phycisphaeraceae bacterium]